MSAGTQARSLAPNAIWLTQAGPQSDVVVASRCRIARNLAGYPFPWRAGELHRKAAAERVLDSLQRAGGELGAATRIAGQIGAEHLLQLLERQYVSLDWAHGSSHRWVAIIPSGSASILINEEDHLRIQVILPGVQVESVIEEAERIEHAIGRHLKYARDPEIGYLTASIANAGSGLRISLLMHLAGLEAEDRLEHELRAAVETGCSVRGLY